MGYYDEQKKARYEKLLKIIEDSEKTLTEKKLVSKMKVEEGLTEETAKTYIKDLLNADKIEKTEEGSIEKKEA